MDNQHSECCTTRVLKLINVNAFVVDSNYNEWRLILYQMCPDNISTAVQFLVVIDCKEFRQRSVSLRQTRLIACTIFHIRNLIKEPSQHKYVRKVVLFSENDPRFNPLKLEKNYIS